MKFEFLNLTVYKKAKDFHNQGKAVVAQKNLKYYEKAL